MSAQRILVVEDEPAVSAFIRQALEEAGYAPVVAGTLAEAQAVFSQERLDLILLDLMLPDGDGIDFVVQLRSETRVPVMMLTARDAVSDRVRGLDAGADDYLAKPFRLEELLARVRALLRRGNDRNERFTLGDLEIDFSSRRVTRGGRVIFLSGTEYGVLELLAKTPGVPVGKAEILRRVWDDQSRDANVVEVYANYLRHKLEKTGGSRLIHTVRGKGYMLSLDASEGPS